jgi:hypothetical protein
VRVESKMAFLPVSPDSILIGKKKTRIMKPVGTALAALAALTALSALAAHHIKI